VGSTKVREIPEPKGQTSETVPVSLTKPVNMNRGLDVNSIDEGIIEII
jgi:hypothetical protein